MTVNFKTYLEIEVEIEASIDPGMPDKFSQSLGCWLPGEAADISDLKVFWDGEDITEKLGKPEITSLHCEVWDEYQEQGE